MKKISAIACAALAAVFGSGWSWFGGKSSPQETAAPASSYLSPEYVAVSADGASVFATCATGCRIASVALDGSATRQWKTVTKLSPNSVSVAPTGLAAAPDGGVYVTVGVTSGELQYYSAAGELKKAAYLGHSPCSPVLSADGKKVFVLNRFQAKVSEVDLAEMKVTRSAAVLREPVSSVLGVDGKFLFVANLLPFCAATNDVVAAAVSIVDTASFAVRNVLLPNGSTGVRGIGASPDGKHVYVTHSMGRYQLPTTQLERGWMNTAALSVFDGASGEYINTVLLDDVDRGAANPWGVGVTADGKNLLVAHAGTCELSVIDRMALHARLDDAKNGKSSSGIVKSAADVPNDLAFLVSIRRRVNLGGNGPRGVACAGGKAVVALYFDESLATLDVGNTAANPEVMRLAPAADLTNDRVRRGEMLYNDGSMCFQQWQSCASCHPDGRADGLNWDLLNDGMGNPKQTKSELFTHCTPPTMVTGIRKDMHECNMAGLVHIQFVTRPEEDVFCFDAYCSSMKPVPSPYLVNGALSEKAKRGEKLFKKAKCADCHTADSKSPAGDNIWTDCTRYDVGLGVGSEAGKMFDTPTLNECWRSAPYLYDGRALTMKDVLTICNPGDVHGETSGLTPQEIDDLAEYVLSL